MAWQRGDIGGRPADLFTPPTPPRFGLLFLHGVGGETLIDDPVFTPLMADLGFACLAPHGGRCWWADKLCPEFDDVLTPERYLLDVARPTLIERWHLGPRAVAALGISMGGQGVLRLGFKYPDLFPAVAGIASAVDYHERHGEGSPIDDMYSSREQCRQDTAPMHVHPSKQPAHIYFCIDPADTRWHRGNDRLHEKLTALGVAHSADLTTEAGGHTWDYFRHMAGPALRFLAAGLTHESRRLL